MTACAPCAAARASWAAGGPHLICRQCEIRAVLGQVMQDRDNFYGQLVDQARRAVLQQTLESEEP